MVVSRPLKPAAIVVVNDGALQVVAVFDSLFMRLLGICLASFSSGERIFFRKVARTDHGL